MQTHKGSCHCGKVQFEFTANVESAMECNCSMCSRKGTVLTFVPAENFKLLSGADVLSDYQFYKKVIHHNFCKNCGVTPFLGAQNPAGQKMQAINLRCVPEIDLKQLPIKMVDGKSF